MFDYVLYCILPKDPHQFLIYIVILIAGVMVCAGVWVGARRWYIRPYRLNALASSSDGAWFQAKLALTFSCFVLVPCAVTALFGIALVQHSVDAWFHKQVGTAIDDSQHVAQAYLSEHKKSVHALTAIMMRALEEFFHERSYVLWSELQNNSVMLQNFLTVYEKLHQVQAMLFTNTEELPPMMRTPWQKRQNSSACHVLAHSALAYNILLQTLSAEEVKQAEENGNRAILDDQGEGVFCVMPLRGVTLVAAPGQTLHLLVWRSIDSSVVQKIDFSRQAAAAYRMTVTHQNELGIQFRALFLLIVIVLLIIALATGLILARRIMEPVSSLIQGAQAVRLGHIEPIPADTLRATKDLRNLMHTFNAMVREMVDKKAALQQLNHQLNERTALMQSVLEAVSSGVLSVGDHGLIHMGNKRACDLLYVRHDVHNRRLDECAPELVSLAARAADQPNGVHQQDCVVHRLGHHATLRVYARAYGQHGHVVLTFDDITAVIQAQQKLAWQDVAQRVAHEIKNPLTPIVLSAQRLGRRYGKHLHHLPEGDAIFHDCVSTIVHQAGMIQNLIKEFADFASLPAPKMRTFAWHDGVAQSVRWYQQAYADIIFRLDLEHVWIHADRQQMEQVLINMLKNAVESIHERWAPKEADVPLTTAMPDLFAGEDASSPAIQDKLAHGHVVISLTHHNGQGILVVRDNGVGLPQTWQAPTAYHTTKSYGTGLGLAIVQKILSDHGGLFSLAPGPRGQGAVACVTVPALSNTDQDLQEKRDEA